jgi:hypothetical protein
MSPMFEKQSRLRLNALAYGQLRRRVLERDGWRCQTCGARTNLEVHHAELRSRGGHSGDGIVERFELDMKLGDSLETLRRYESALKREFFQYVDCLERLQRREPVRGV